MQLYPIYPHDHCEVHDVVYEKYGQMQYVEHRQITFHDGYRTMTIVLLIALLLRVLSKYKHLMHQEWIELELC